MRDSEPKSRLTISMDVNDPNVMCALYFSLNLFEYFVFAQEKEMQSVKKLGQKLFDLKKNLNEDRTKVNFFSPSLCVVLQNYLF